MINNTMIPKNINNMVNDSNISWSSLLVLPEDGVVLVVWFFLFGNWIMIYPVLLGFSNQFLNQYFYKGNYKGYSKNKSKYYDASS